MALRLGIHGNGGDGEEESVCAIAKSDNLGLRNSPALEKAKTRGDRVTESQRVRQQSERRNEGAQSLKTKTACMEKTGYGTAGLPEENSTFFSEQEGEFKCFVLTIA